MNLQDVLVEYLSHGLNTKRPAMHKTKNEISRIKLWRSNDTTCAEI